VAVPAVRVRTALSTSWPSALASNLVMPQTVDDARGKLDIRGGRSRPRGHGQGVRQDLLPSDSVRLGPGAGSLGVLARRSRAADLTRTRAPRARSSGDLVGQEQARRECPHRPCRPCQYLSRTTPFDLMCSNAMCSNATLLPPLGRPKCLMRHDKGRYGSRSTNTPKRLKIARGSPLVWVRFHLRHQEATEGV
jgi:hypothetical protein